MSVIPPGYASPGLVALVSSMPPSRPLRNRPIGGDRDSTALGDTRSPAELASNLPAAGCCWPGLRSRPVMTTGIPQHLRAAALGDLTPRQALVRQILLASAAIEHGDPAAASLLGSALHNLSHGWRSGG